MHRHLLACVEHDQVREVAELERPPDTEVVIHFDLPAESQSVVIYVYLIYMLLVENRGKGGSFYLMGIHSK